MKTKTRKSIRNAVRCQYFTPTGRQCCSLAIDTRSSLCPRHAAAQEHSDRVDHSAVLTYMASLMLRTLPLMHKSPGKYVYRLIGGTRPPSQADYFIEGEDQADQANENSVEAEPDDVPKKVEAQKSEAHAHAEAEVAETDEAQEGLAETDEAQKGLAETDEAQKKVASQNSVPPGHSPLPASREAFLDAVDKARQSANGSGAPLDDPDTSTD